MYAVVKNTNNHKESLLEMANLCGKYINTDSLDFSFYFSSKEECGCGMQGIRVKIKWNRETTRGGMDGTMELHGDYDYEQSESRDSIVPNSKQLESARAFFKKYKVLFSAVWESVLDPQPVQDYFRGIINFEDLMSEIDLGNKSTESMGGCSSIQDLESKVRSNNLFDMND